MFSLNILTGISLLWQAFLLSSFCNSLNIFFLSINLEENYRLFVSIISLILRIHGCFSYLPLDCTKNWISNGLGYTIPPPTTSQNISTATHDHPPPATIHPPPPTITQKMDYHPAKAKIYSYTAPFDIVLTVYFFFEMQYFRDEGFAW